ncbi:GDP-L-fucose synthase family protein [Polaribacter cellanae]|uniref:GDP-L-fucose synthase n=1 Tax=Polaribacter cellanae TaxID=2818493 RepID=A0A975H8D9_9FLAO|nr:GDP-L-fucose synthase [Polaribacter cellanae]QTE21495.1 GDP-L-fucose synthase [Polaribacter cellanae]
MNKSDKIFLAGHRGLVGSALLKNLQGRGFKNIVTKTHKELDLTNQQATANFFAKEKPDYVFLAAAKVGGIVANNTYRADFIYHNLMIQNNVIHESYVSGVKKLLFLGSTCIYPKNATQPIKEDSLLTDVLEYTNEPYAIAKIAGIKLCESYNLQYRTNFISVMPTNLYGPNDNFDLEKSHVLPALIKKIHLAKLLEEGKKDAVVKDLGVSNFGEAETVLSKFGVSSENIEVWGTGNPMREFLWSEDMADACVHIMQNVDFKDLIKDKKDVRNTHINIGTGNDISIKDLANLIKEIVGYKGKFVFNKDKPDGTMRKVTDVSKLEKLGWQHAVKLEKGVQMMYDWYLK